MVQRSLLTIGNLNGVDIAVKAAMKDACKESHLSREEIIDRMNELAQASGVLITGGNTKQLTVHTFDKWLSPKACDQLPSLRALVVFCEVVDGVGPLSAMAEPLGGRVIDEQQARRLKRAEIDDQIKQLKKLKKQLED